MVESSDKQIYFHVGMPKTASTFLQRNVFPEFQGIRFIKKHDFKHHASLIEQSGTNKVVLSIELNLDAKGGFSKMRTIADKYPGTHPIIVLRRHGSWLQSKYKYYIRKHGTASFREYYHPERTDSILPEENLHYFDKIKLLEKNYGKRPLVLFQEELKKNPQGFIAILARFIGAEYDPGQIKITTVKRSYDDHQLKHVRRFNRWYGFSDKNCRNKVSKFAYKKFSAFLLHAVAFAGNFLHEDEEEFLVPPSMIKTVNEAFTEDWQQCLNYARQDRQLLI